MTKVEVQKSPIYEEKYEELEDNIQSRIDDKLDLIKKKPTRNSKPLQNSAHKGMRRYQVGDYRLIYLWCKEAMKMDGTGHEVKPILEADHISEDNLILIDVGPRKHIYDNYG